MGKMRSDGWSFLHLSTWKDSLRHVSERNRRFIPPVAGDLKRWQQPKHGEQFQEHRLTPKPQSKPGIQMVNLEPCQKRGYPQLFMAGIGPY